MWTKKISDTKSNLETMDAKELASSLRKLADRWDEVGSHTQAQCEHETQAMIGVLSRQLITQELKQCHEGDWRKALGIVGEVGGYTDVSMRDILTELVNAKQFLGESRKVADVQDRRDLVRQLNALAERLAIQVALPGSTSPPRRRTCLVVAGKNNDFGICHREIENRGQTTMGFPGVATHVLPELKFSPRQTAERGL
jgi:hypothetical protein